MTGRGGSRRRGADEHAGLGRAPSARFARSSGLRLVGLGAAASMGLVLLVGATATTDVGLADCGRVEDGWRELPDPPVGAGLVDVGVDSRAPGRVVVTDGLDVALSTDGACTWRMLARPEVPGDATRSGLVISDVEIGHQPSGDIRLWALGFVTEAALNRPPVLFRSDDGGLSWVQLGDDVAPQRPFMNAECGPGTWCGVHVVPDDPDGLLLRVGDQMTSGVVYLSEDAGESFEQVTPRVGTEVDEGEVPTRSLLPAGLRDLDMLGRDLAVGVSYDSVRVSTDGARTFRPVIETDFADDTMFVAGANLDLSPIGLDDDALAVLGVVRPDGSTHRLVGAVLPGAGLLTMSFPGGRIQALDAAASGTAVLLTSGLGVQAVPVGTTFGEPVDLGVPPGEGHDRLQVVGEAAESVIWVHGPRGLARLTADLALPLPTEPPSPAYDLPDFDPAAPLGPVPGTLRPHTEAVRLEPGESFDVGYELVVPERPLPVDVFFLFDESGSMDAEIDALRRGVSDIVADLESRGVDLWVGVGGYANEWRYQRYRQIGPPDVGFSAALQRVGKGGSSGTEAAYSALHQVATGSGLPDRGAAPGQNAEWRPGALRIVINLGDERLQEYPGDPTRADAIEALQHQRIMHIGLVSEFELVVDGQGWWDVTAATGAFAGPSGVDCDSDGDLEVQPGGPILCFIPLVAAADPAAEVVEELPDMASVVVEVVDAVTEVVDIGFHTDRPDVVTRLVSDPPLTSYDLHSGVAAGLTATMTCTEALFGQSLPVRVTAVAHAIHLATSVVRFGCGVPPPVAAVPVQPAQPVVAAIAPAPAPAAAPAPPAPPAQAASSVTSTAASPAHAPGVQGAIAGANQRQTQAQAAGLGRDASSRDDARQLLATATRRDDPTPITLAAGAVMSVGAATALSRRSRGPQVQRAAITRRRPRR